MNCQARLALLLFFGLSQSVLKVSALKDSLAFSLAKSHLISTQHFVRVCVCVCV